MGYTKFMAVLLECFDAIERNQYHIQVPTLRKGRWHNIWITKSGPKYLRPDAAIKEKASTIYTFDEIIKLIRRYQDQHEDIVDLKKAK